MRDDAVLRRALPLGKGITITVHSVMAPSGELRGKGRCGEVINKHFCRCIAYTKQKVVCLQVKLCDLHLSALEVRFLR